MKNKTEKKNKKDYQKPQIETESLIASVLGSCPGVDDPPCNADDGTLQTS